MHKYLEKKNEVHFDKIFNQVFGKYHQTNKIMYYVLRNQTPASARTACEIVVLKSSGALYRGFFRA